MLLNIPFEMFGCMVGFDEENVKKNLPLYRRYAVGTLPNYWRKESVMDEWNRLICSFCNELPEGTTELSKRQLQKMRFKYLRLLIKDCVPSIGTQG